MEVNELANNDEKYLDGPGLTDILTRQKGFNDDFEYRITTNEIQLSDKTKLTGPELKQICQSGRSNIFQIGDVIDVGNGIAICMNKDVQVDADGNDMYSDSQINTYKSDIVEQGDTYSYMFIMFPKTKTVCGNDVCSDARQREQNITELNNLYSGMNDIKDCIDETVLYSELYLQQQVTYPAYKSKSKLHVIHVIASGYADRQKTGIERYGYDYPFLNIIRSDNITKILDRLDYLTTSTSSPYYYLRQIVTRSGLINSSGTFLPQNNLQILKNTGVGGGSSIKLTSYDLSNYNTTTYLVPIFFIGKQS